jgi:hypothetical protein
MHTGRLGHATHGNRAHRTGTAERLVAVALVSGALVAGCGRSSPSETTATVGGATTSASTKSATTKPAAAGSGPVAFAECMRANGAPNFADPNAAGAGTGEIPVGNNPAAPAFKAAATKCERLMPGSAANAPVFPGDATHPSAQAMAMLRRIAVCMRADGVPQFPDPLTSMPSSPAGPGVGEITDYDNAILVFPATIDRQAPAYRQALTACSAPPLGLPH